jgi:putative ABC transport system substrate-binding protein
MRRRKFIVGLSAAAVWPSVAVAQQPRGMRRIGVLMGIGEDDPEAKPRVDALRQGLQERGWKEGQTIQLEYRPPEISTGRNALPGKSSTSSRT